MSKQIRNRLEIPCRFRRVVILHIVKNFLPQASVRVPLLLGIHGPSGEGKTFQCEQIVEEMDAKLLLISGGQLESHDAGEPARLVRTTYLNAGRTIERGESKIAVVMINDVDTGLGNWGEMVQYTINRQTVFGELMHLVDYPTSVEGRTTKRIPIIITGNDFTKLYEPLVRAGRMSSFQWIPTLDEKASMISCIFPEINIKQCKSLISELENEANRLMQSDSESLPVSVYSHLRSILSDDYLWTEINKVGIRETIDLISKGYYPKVELTFNFRDLVDAGKVLIQSGQLLNHLRRTK